MNTVNLQLSVNGQAVNTDIDPRTLLVQLIRDQLHLTGTHVGCDTAQCGCCTVHLDGQAVKSCSILAVQAQGKRVQTIEGLSDQGELAILQQAFLEHNAMQCGFCTPGMLLTARALMHEQDAPSRDMIRAYISGNYCRCTGYQAIVDAIETAIIRSKASGAKRASGASA